MRDELNPVSVTIYIRQSTAGTDGYLVPSPCLTVAQTAFSIRIPAIFVFLYRSELQMLSLTGYEPTTATQANVTAYSAEDNASFSRARERWVREITGASDSKLQSNWLSLLWNVEDGVSMNSRAQEVFSNVWNQDKKYSRGIRELLSLYATHLEEAKDNPEARNDISLYLTEMSQEDPELNIPVDEVDSEKLLQLQDFYDRRGKNRQENYRRQAMEINSDLASLGAAIVIELPKEDKEEEVKKEKEHNEADSMTCNQTAMLET